MAKREQEIARLGSEAAKGRDVDVAALQYRSQTQENIILQLNQQVLEHNLTVSSNEF